MKPEHNSRRLFGITRSKGKMYELGLPQRLHIAVPEYSEPQQLFLLTVGILGDVAAFLSNAEDINTPLSAETLDEIGFAASFFDAFLQSKFSEELDADTALLAASAYYLARRPGSSFVLARMLDENAYRSPVEKLLHWALRAQWNEYPTVVDPYFKSALTEVARLLAYHFYDGSGLEALTSELNALRRRAYAGASSRDLLFIDIVAAVIRMRLAASAWTTLPEFTGIPIEQWESAIRRPEFPKELWPSQILLGRTGLFSGESGVIQMPTSAGKTRAIEIILRSGFLSGRTTLAVVVAPFRALCHEIGTSLRHAFRKDAVKVNELSDAMQLDFLDEIAELLGAEEPSSQYILVLTPEKLLYVLRQSPSLVNNIGIVVYDEGHQFDSGSRGVTYELLLTEIKSLLPTQSQTVLISAVIQNAKAIGEWLIGDGVQLVNGAGLLPTARSVAFASWSESLGQLMFFESTSFDEPDYFVPRVIEQQDLAKRGKETKNRIFPEKNKTNDVALYLGIRLVPQGSVAIFCGRKDTASGIAARAVDIFERGFHLPAPTALADRDELQKLKNLIVGHFGDASVTSRAASYGIFVHHGVTPHGLRLSIEYAMQKGRINFVICTSTLAQGVNLPIRYLVVPGIWQAGDKIKVRDFQNLIGRAGRSGMHTEGMVVFSDPTVYDTRLQKRAWWKFKSSVELLSPERSESTTSSLLGVLAPFESNDVGDKKGALHLNADDLCELLLYGEGGWQEWAERLVIANPGFTLDAKSLVAELRRRRKLLFALESHLMANRGITPFEEFEAEAERLGESTLAHHLAADEMKAAVRAMFLSVARYIEQLEPLPEKQNRYSKTLLGLKRAQDIEHWVATNRGQLLALESNEDWLRTVWNLFLELLDDSFLTGVQPTTLPFQLATDWLQGHPYVDLLSHSDAEQGSKPWGANKRRRLTQDDIVDFCEQTLGYECSLVVAAVGQFLFGETIFVDDASASLILFQKAFKYGLPDWLSISCFELGFSDRVVAQRLCDIARASGFVDPAFGPALESLHEELGRTLAEYPSYFESVLASRR